MGDGSWVWPALGAWFLAQFTPQIQSAIARHRVARGLRKALVIELGELRITMAQLEWIIRAKTGALDLAFVNWYLPAVLEIQDPVHGTDVRTVATRIHAMTDGEKSGYVNNAMSRSRKRGPFLNLQKYELPFLEANVSQLDLFEPYFQRSLLAVRSAVSLLNGSVDTAETIKWKIIDHDGNQVLTDELKGNLNSQYDHIGAMAHSVADQIGVVLKHKDC